MKHSGGGYSLVARFKLALWLHVQEITNEDLITIMMKYPNITYEELRALRLKFGLNEFGGIENGKTDNHD